MKNEEQIISINNNPNKNILNSLIKYNSYTSNDFKKINSSNNIINTSGSQPIVIYKKISKSLTQTFPDYKSNQAIKNNNYVSDGGLKKKLSKYKSYTSNNNQINPSYINIKKNNKNIKDQKTMRNINKKLNINKKEKSSKSKEKIHLSGNNDENIKEKERTKFTKKFIKKKEVINTDYQSKHSHSQGHFNRKNKIFQNNFINKSINGININTSNNYYKKNIDNKNKIIKNKEIKNNKINKLIVNKENKRKEIKESEKLEEQRQNEVKEQRKRKIEYVDSLIKNGVLNITKELNFTKKLTPKEILNKKKKDFLKINGFTEINIDNNESKIKYPSQINYNIKSIRKKHISTKQSNIIKNKTNNKLNISKLNSRFISFLNNNTNNNINTNTNITNINMTNTNITNIITNNLDTQSSNKNYKKITLKPQINQFEFLNKIQQEQKKLSGHKKLYTSRGIEKHLQIKDYEPKLTDSFRHSNSNSKLNINIDIYMNMDNKKNNLQKNFYEYKKNKILFEENDEFPFSHKKSYRSHQEISNF